MDLGGSGDGGAGANPVLGAWTGYIENYQFPTGSDSIDIVVSQQPDGSLSGSLTFSDEPPPPPPVANVGYPPIGGKFPLNPASAEGFVFTARNVSWEDGRLQMGISTFDIWSAWCSLQTPQQWSPGQYGCAASPGGSTNLPGCGCCGYATSDGTEIQEDCGMMQLCGVSVCTCTAMACGPKTIDDGEPPDPDVLLDLHYTPGHLDGSVGSPPNNGVLLTDMDGHNVHFEPAH